MQNRVSPVQSANRVLQAFRYAYAGAEITANAVADHFEQHAYPIQDMVAGIQFAALSGWVDRTSNESLRLTMKGMEMLHVSQASVPPSTFNAWAHS